MRFVKAVLAVALIAAFVVPAAQAQRSPGSYSIGGFGGLSMLQGPEELKDMLKGKIGYGGELKYNINEKTSFVVAYSILPLGFSDAFQKDLEDMISMITYYELADQYPDLTPEDIESSIEGGGAKVNVISANLLQYLTPPEASAGFYVTLGGGYYMFKTSEIDKVEVTVGGETIDITDDFNEGFAEDDEDDNKFGINAGLGAEFQVNEKIHLFVEGKYHYIFTEEEETEDPLSGETVKSGGKTSIITVLGGLRFNLN